MKIDKQIFSEKIDNLVQGAGKITANVTEKTKELAGKSKQAVVNTIDVNGDGKIDMEDIIIVGLKTPGVGIDRDDFLKKELMKKYPENVIKKAIRSMRKQDDDIIAEIDYTEDQV